MRFQSYFNTALKIIQLYDGLFPLQHFLKQYFSQQKKHGSKDRKYITHLCYNFYRLGKSLSNVSAEEKLKLAVFLCNDNIGEWSFLYDDEWQNNWNDSLTKRLQFIGQKYSSFSLSDVFPFADELSESPDIPAFIRSFFIQPHVFIRVRPGHDKQVIRKLQEKAVPFNVIDESCIALSPFVKINSIINIDEESVIQDYSSQRIKEFLHLTETENLTSNILNLKSVWDCCAGSGGKSILAYDVLKNINLTASDVRPSIIQNLKQRFEKAGINRYKSFVVDLTNSKFPIPNSSFDLIICDAPCTGSGTWSRTPEQLYFFQHEKIEAYASLQKKIVANAISYLKISGYFLYITCSVFKEENETVVAFIKNELHLELTKTELLKGYHQKADTMFAALFRKTT
ncbi:MAG TPA: methyltransferase domain-containing protein [Parafilimonas sp.]|nr:methyltransferase domain-containing protein [Parafilimonas sp.]